MHYLDIWLYSNYITSRIHCLTESVGSRVIYISTDYVFDGVSPPFTIDDAPRPLNKYGITKLDGEKAVLAANSGNLL